VRRLRLFLASVGRRTINFPPVSPPMGLLCLAAYLRERFRLDVRIVDQYADGSSVNDIVQAAAEFEADVVGFRALTSSARALAEATRKARAALPGALIVLGGPHVSASGAKAMEDTAADAAVAGEGELAFEQILGAYGNGTDLSGIPGVFRRDSDGGIVANPGEIAPIEDLDSLPFPAYDLIDLRKYWRLRSMSQVPPRRYVSLLTSRGCPYQCMYCHRIFGKRFRAQSAERIVAEVEHYVRVFGLSEIEFLDDIFNQDRQRVLDFCDLVQRRGLKLRIAFPNALRGDRLTQEVVDALVDAGTYYSACALETGSPRVQQFIGKRLDIPRFLEGVEMLVQRGVLTHGFTMLGFPTEAEDEMRQTIDVACNSKLHTATFFTVTPYPNTELHALVERTHPEKLVGLDYEDQDYTGIAVNLSAVPDEVLYASQRKAWRRFYLNPMRLVRLARDFPQPQYLPRYLPMLMLRLGKGLFARR